jgi:hypothetical protein
MSASTASHVHSVSTPNREMGFVRILTALTFLFLAGCTTTSDQSSNPNSISSDKSSVILALKGVDARTSCKAEWSWKKFGCTLTNNKCNGTPEYSWSVAEGCSCKCSENICNYKPQDCSFVRGGEPRCSKTFEGPPVCITYDCRKCPDGKLYGFSYEGGASWCDGQQTYPCE